MVGHRFLAPLIGVRIPVGQPSRARLSRTRRVDDLSEVYSEIAYLLRAVTKQKNHPQGWFFCCPLAYTPWGVYTTHMKYMDETNKAKVVRRLKLLEGQVRGLQKMVENDTYCIDIITQTSAVKQGLSNVEDMLLENHLGHCVFHQIQSGQTKKAK